jgi:hypothetical protein
MHRGTSPPILRLLLAPEPAAPAQEHYHLVVEDLLAGVGEHSGDPVAHDGGVALVDDLEEPALGDELRVGGDGVLLDLEVLLAVQEHHGAEVGDDGVEGVGELGVEGGDYAEGGNCLEVFGALAVGGEWG